MTDFRERRAGVRVELRFPVTVRGVDAVGEPLDIDTVLDNVARGGLYLRLPRRVEPGAQLTVGIRVFRPLGGEIGGPRRNAGRGAAG